MNNKTLEAIIKKEMLINIGINRNNSCIWIHYSDLQWHGLLVINRNNSCIWMCLYTYLKGTQWRLIETIVVFELEPAPQAGSFNVD